MLHEVVSLMETDPTVRRGPVGLLAAVLKLSLEGMQSADRHEREEARRYFESGACFHLLCGHLGAGPDHVRRAVLRNTK